MSAMPPFRRIPYLSAGHSTVDPGACAFGRKEADVVSEFRNLTSFYLHRAGIEHHVDGVGTQNVPLGETVRDMRGCSPCIEFHCNAGSPRATGVETLSGPKDMALAAKLCAAISGAFGITNRGAKPEDSGQHHRLAFVQAGGIIVELFFITNASNLAAYDARKWLAAKAVAEVLIGEQA